MQKSAVHTRKPAEDKISPADRVKRLTEITGRLTEIIDRESEALKKREIKEAAKLAKDKTQLAASYATDVRYIQKNPLIVDRIPAEDIKELKAVMTTLSSRLDRNRSLLGAAKSVSEGLMKAVSKISANRRAPTTGYGAGGALQQTSQVGVNTLALDQKV